MKLRRTAAKAPLVGAMSIAAAGFGAGLPHAVPPSPPPPPWPIPAHADGSGANVAAAGNAAPAGHDLLPPPGNGGAMRQDAVVPMWAPPAPPPPIWAPWQPVVWNTELNAWGVWWNGSFQTLQSSQRNGRPAFAGRPFCVQPRFNRARTDAALSLASTSSAIRCASTVSTARTASLAAGMAVVATDNASTPIPSNNVAGRSSVAHSTHNHNDA